MKEHRTIQMSFRNTESEVKRIRNRMSLVGMKSPSAYLRKMAMDGYIVVIDLRDVREANQVSVKSELYIQGAQVSVTVFVK